MKFSFAKNDDPLNRISSQNTRYPVAVHRLKVTESFLQVLGVGATIVQHGLINLTETVQWELGASVVFSLLALCITLGFRFHWSLLKPSFFRRHRPQVLLSVGWVLGVLAIIAFGTSGNGETVDPRFRSLLLWSELSIVLRAIFTAIQFTRRSTAHAGTNSAILFALSFLILIATGTFLLMLPRAVASPELLELPFLERLRVALFTATSASCVTGLIVVDTGTHWSPLGQAVIMGMFQIGGLGIMTCGAFFAVFSGRSMSMRESATLHEVLEANDLDTVKRLVLGILGFTLATELLGAWLLSGLWADQPRETQIFYSLFHSVSAFCNAGFTLTPNSFVGMDTSWQVWFVLTSLIIIGGLGFAVLYNIALVSLSYIKSIQKQPLFNLSQVRTRLSISSRIVVITTLSLLVVGAITIFLLEAMAPVVGDGEKETVFERIAHAWFQSVTFRTAGFNTVDLGALQPATKLFAIFLMFVGAAPGSTGGGIKVMVFALAVLRVTSLLQGRDRIEFGNRIIPDDVVNRALTVLALGIVASLATTMLIVIFEQDQDLFLDHLFEGVSAFATVGVSSVDTKTLSAPSQIVIMFTMFLGRVGPLTILIGLAGEQRKPNYDYPIERLPLG